ncbi:hypothetical protein [Gordonia soli]|uniref:DUF1453 domain-containing protein n=1 Tax=Gordonia soli NBRC 108243 TaxID=1223545 RepID=M0QMD5_9ACTN|nr:hypothetical protein [Gordonia soli]GAC69579.1 hypothetical protein GS4_26_00260 [Gordonia soli NBRC 108243]
MTIPELLILIALMAYAVYRQSRRHELVGSTRFKMALIYIGVGLLIGGLRLPVGLLGYAFFAASIALSVVVGLIRGRYTRISADGDGHVYVQGTIFTIFLFIGMIVIKFALGTTAYLLGNSSHGGFGEIIIMIGVMIAVQAEILWRRAQPLSPRQSATSASTMRSSPTTSVPENNQ